MTNFSHVAQEKLWKKKLNAGENVARKNLCLSSVFTLATVGINLGRHGVEFVIMNTINTTGKATKKIRNDRRSKRTTHLEPVRPALPTTPKY